MPGFAARFSFGASHGFARERESPRAWSSAASRIRCVIAALDMSGEMFRPESLVCSAELLICIEPKILNIDQVNVARG